MKSLTTNDLAPNHRNPRSISEERLIALRKSLQTFGDISAITYNVRTKRLVGGHQRVKALCDRPYKIEARQHQRKTKQGTVGWGVIKLGEEELQCRFVDWDEKKEKAAMIAANKHGGDWILEGLKELLGELDDGSLDMDLTGFLKDELEAMMTAAPPEGEPGEGGSDETKLHTCPECGHKFKDNDGESG